MGRKVLVTLYLQATIETTTDAYPEGWTDEQIIAEEKQYETEDDLDISFFLEDAVVTKVDVEVGG